MALRGKLWACAGAAIVVAASCTLDRSGLPATGGSGPTGSGGATSTGSLTSSSGTSVTSSGGGASSTGGASSASSAASTGAGGKPGEICTNAVDDDGDGLIDCDDPDCAGFVEVPETKLPMGSLDPNKCAGSEVTGNECSACSACSVTPGDCILEVAFFDNMGCKNAPLYKSAQNGACDKTSAIDLNAGNAFYRATEVSAPGFQCTKGMSTVGASHSFCIGAESSVYKSKMKNVSCQPQGMVCVRLQGDVNCPMGFMKRTVFDSKGACACDCNATEDCPGLSGSFDDQGNCGMVNHVIKADGKCQDAMLMSVDTVKFPSSQTGTNAKCTNVEPVDITVCCH